MSQILPGVEVGPTGKVAGTAIWLHGLGADGHDYESIVPLLDLPDVRFVFPHAPRRPVTLNGGLVMPAWYDLVTLEDLERKSDDIKGILASAAAVEALIEREGERGVPPSRVVLAGFSQGGAVALYTGTRYRERLLGIMVLSAYELMPREPIAQQANALTPLLSCHGLFDPMVPIDAGREAYQKFAQGGRRAEWHEFPMGHQVVPDEIRVIRDWLKGIFRQESTP
jgi:phospholipase/carboxylesterase